MTSTTKRRNNDIATKQHDGPKSTSVNAASENIEIMDLLGIGFGPANLSLAIAIEETNIARNASEQITACFVESQQQFGWHDGMLLPNTDMQISYLKDLASLRNPISDYTFVHYLHEQGRLSDFINLKTFFPSRKEFHDYLSWAASRVCSPVHYGMRAKHIEWVGDSYEVTVEQVSGEQQTPVITIFRARNVVLGVGLQPVLPEGVEPSSRIFHNHQFLHRLSEVPDLPNKSFVVVGSGQSAAEVVLYLHQNFPESEVHVSFRRFGFSPSDDTPYANRIFDPETVDNFYHAPEAVKQRLVAQHWLTNYSAVDSHLIEELYRREYEERVVQNRRLFVHRVTEVEHLDESDDVVTVKLRDAANGDSETIKADAIIFATGFVPGDIRPMFGPSIDIAGAFQGALPVVDRDYRLRLSERQGRIFLNGGVEHSHGLSSSLLSNVSMRAADILASFSEPVPVTHV